MRPGITASTIRFTSECVTRREVSHVVRVICGHYGSAQLRQDAESADAIRAVDREIAAVEGEDAADLFPLRYANERGVGEIHREIAVLFHQLTHAGQVLDFDLDEIERHALDHFPQRALRLPR